MQTPTTYLICDLTFYAIDEDGNEVPWRVEWPTEIGNGDRGDKNKYLTGF